ncbi:exodeoxyribonuclease I [Desulfobacula phenolica]|uniref:Exodeoxyribonuclease I subunit C n=1 Tax=Desulfobacula phenolica TaxID=90732 RepID=A0A1H2DNW1_9BACT|nr:exodeoxyribonuclease I [Desulfobacula phenolica]SDT84529.1 Exodeoxyribonuclease I subunit C [Desulfobacula phenolica]
MKTFLFYDIETSGLNPAFDQILTFAFIRTDFGLNEIDRQTITIRLRKDIVPSPKAFLTHGLTYDELEHGISEYEAALKIHNILNTPGTISLGYNSLGFDDVFLRFLFYRNLLDPYLHQYGNGCYRMDILPITAVFRVFYPSCLKWPCIDGKPSLKLDLISSENRFVTSGKAHEAMNDVEAVIELVRKLVLQKDIWKYCLEFFNKTRDEIRISRIEKTFDIQSERFSVCIMVSASFGAGKNYLVPVIRLGESRVYKNQSLWLRLDSDDIIGLDADQDLKDTFVIRKRPGDALIVLPALERFWEKLPEASQKSANENMDKIRHHREKFFEFIEYHCSYKYPFVPNIDPDAALYQDGFFSSLEKKQSDLFHKASNNRKKETLQKIQSPRIKKLAGRIFDRNFKDETGQSKDSEYHLYLNRLRSSLPEDQFIGYKNDIKFNCKQGMRELKEVEQELLSPNQDQKKMLGWLKEYIMNLSIPSA